MTKYSVQRVSEGEDEVVDKCLNTG